MSLKRTRRQLAGQRAAIATALASDLVTRLRAILTPERLDALGYAVSDREDPPLTDLYADLRALTRDTP